MSGGLKCGCKALICVRRTWPNPSHPPRLRVRLMMIIPKKVLEVPLNLNCLGSVPSAHGLCQFSKHMITSIKANIPILSGPSALATHSTPSIFLNASWSRRRIVDASCHLEGGCHTRKVSQASPRPCVGLVIAASLIWKPRAQFKLWGGVVAIVDWWWQGDESKFLQTF